MKVSTFITVIALSLGAMAGVNDPHKVIGDDDLVVVRADASNLPLRYRPLVDAFGLMNMGCTGTHIGNGIVLTAGHCFWAGSEPKVDMDCRDTKIDWGVREGQKPYMTSQCERIIIAQEDDVNDYAIIRVSPVPPVAIAPDMQRRATTGDTVTVFSHPEGRPLQWSGPCGVEMGQHEELPIGSIQHKCDTKRGSSGATIINVLTLKVIGIHGGGLDGGVWMDPEHPGSPMATGMNYGTYIQNSPLREALLSLGFN